MIIGFGDMPTQAPPSQILHLSERDNKILQINRIILFNSLVFLYILENQNKNRKITSMNSFQKAEGKSLLEPSLCEGC